jgi:outer membrane biosynthesis protein TonB
MNEQHIKLISGLLAWAIYLLVIVLIAGYVERIRPVKPIHFVRHNDPRIEVALTAPAASKAPKNPEALSKPKKAKDPKPSVKPSDKTKRPPQKSTPKIKKEMRKPQPKNHNKHQPPKPALESLFAGVQEKRPQKTPTKSQQKATLKKVSPQDRGIKNAYYAKVEEMLRNWPAQSEFAGERVHVRLTIDRDGSFDYRLLRRSANSAFNAVLVAYLKQLQNIGFGRHEHPRAYEIDVEFVATQ